MLNRKFLADCCIVCAGVAVYANVLQGPFQFDDRVFVVNNGAIRDLFDLKAIWSFWPTRFVTIFSFALNYHIHQLQVFGYHLFNLVFHIGAALLVSKLVLLTFDTPVMKGQGIGRHSRLLALFAGLIFAVHPVQTEAVAYISGRAVCLGAFFYLLSFFLYVKSRLHAHRSYYIASMVAALFALLSKEHTMTLPVMLMLYEHYFFRTKAGFICKKALPFFIMVVGLLVLMFLSRSSNAAIGKTYFLGSTQNGLALSPGQYLLTQFQVLVTYLRLVFVPLGQSIDHDHPIAGSFLEPATLGSFLFLAALAVTAVRMRLKYPLVSFGMCWFFLAILPESSIVPLRDVLVEYRLYLPTFGFALFLVAAAYYVLTEKRNAWLKAGLAMIVACYALLAYNRNLVWQDEIRLWSDAIEKSPRKSRAYLNRGWAYQAQGDFSRAMADYNKAMELDPGSYKAYHNRGVLYQQKGDLDRALLDYNKVIELWPGSFNGHYNRGVLYYQQHDLERALDDYNKAIALDPAYAKAYNNRGLLYREAGQFDLAIADFNKAIELLSNYAEAYNNRASVYVKEGELDRARRDLDKAVELDPHNEAVSHNRDMLLKNSARDF